MGQNLPEKIEFINELDQVMEVKIKYEWKPITCTACKGMGHYESECKKPAQNKKLVWRPKEVIKSVQQREGKQVAQPAKELTFQAVKKPTKRQEDPTSLPFSQNVFDILADGEDQVNKDVNDDGGIEKDAGGGSPLKEDG